MRQQLVHLRALGLSRSGQNTSQEVESYATGFIVSEDGLVLTVYHLISELGDIAPDTVRIEARIASKHTDALPAAVVDASVPTDVMLLKLPPAAEPYASLGTKLGRAIDHKEDDDVYTSGFPKVLDYRKQSGKIEARHGPGGYLWATNLQFLAGQSGSPVYDSEGTVIAVVKGDAENVGYIIPIGYADALLAQVRLREIANSMRDFEVLRKQFRWEGEAVANDSGLSASIWYEKSVGGEPHVDSIDVEITLRGRRISNGEERDVGPYPLIDIPRVAQLGRTGWTFRVSDNDFGARIRQYAEDFEMTFDEVRVDIVPTLTDGSELRRKRIEFEID
jgi:hypothetical protein